MVQFVLADFLPYQLAVLANRVSAEFSCVYKERYGISIAQWRIVAHLSQTSEPVSVREICARVEMEKSKVSRAVSRLQMRGFVAKSVNPNDRRLVELTLSESGRAMVGELAPLARAFESELLKALAGGGADFRRHVRDLLAETGQEQ